MDEQEKQERRAAIRLVVTEILMFLAVILLVGFLTLVVMGYSFNLRELGGSGEIVERTGLVQISSVPTGATITIDDDSPLLLRTNGSRTVLAGAHEISLSRDGYDSWTKTISVTEGLMYRLNYPRLFPLEHEPETVLDFNTDAATTSDTPAVSDAVASENIVFSSVSPNKEKLLLVRSGKFYYLDLNAPNPTLKPLAIENLAAVETIEEVSWSGNSERFLSKVNGEFFILNLSSPKTSGFLSSFAKVDGLHSLKFETESGERILALTSENSLVELNLRDKKLSDPLLSGVLRFDNDGERIIFLTKSEDAFEARTFLLGDEQSVLLGSVSSSSARLATMKYFQDYFFAIVEDKRLTVLSSSSWLNAETTPETVAELPLDFSATALKKRGKGMVFVASSAEKTAVFDLEALTLTSYSLPENSGWVDEFLCYSVSEAGKLTVFDYDNLNLRTLVESGVSANLSVTISGNNRWLYYFKDSKLLREKLN